MNRVSAGRKGHNWRKLTANLRAQRRPCWLCGQPIRYDLAWPHPDSFSTDHVAELVNHPELAEDPTNLRAAHLLCNTSRGARAPKPSIGTTSRHWGPVATGGRGLPNLNDAPPRRPRSLRNISPLGFRANRSAAKFRHFRGGRP